MGMNPIAYRTTGLFVRTLSTLSKAHINIHGKENIPAGAVIYVVNHFTRIETAFLPTYIFNATHIPVWSLADFTLFKGAFGRWLDSVGAVSTKNPDRDRLIVKSLLTGEASWIIFPEGRMVKDKKNVEKGRYMLFLAGGKRPPHTGAATLAMRTEFYRHRLRKMARAFPQEAERIRALFRIENIESVLSKQTYIVPINLTYYPIRARENILSAMADHLLNPVPGRIREEIMTEGTMLLSGVDIDMRIGKPIAVEPFLDAPIITQDILADRQINFDDPIPSRPTMRKKAVLLMLKYMAAIYGMTTVNYDHLFASILRMYPVKHIDAYGWRQRVFLAASQPLEQMGIFCHKSLTENQVHLLTDDYFKRYEDFVSVALDKHVIRPSGKGFLKDPRKLSIPFDFHSIRIENPVTVIANEIEPLTKLQRNLRRLSWTPRFMIRRKIVRRLIHRSVREYEKDYAAHYSAEESKDKAVGMPFLIRGRERNIGVLLIHGYMAAPLEVSELAGHLGRKGIWVYAPRLRGHATSPDDLAGRSYQEWILSVETGYAIIRNICKRVVIGGFSTGAGLALELSTRVEDAVGVFAVCPPMRLHDFSARFVPAVDVWNRLMKRMQLNGAKMEFVENHPENPHINYLRNPISGIRELERLMEFLEPKLPGVASPTLVIQSHGDPVVNPKGSRRLFDLLGSGQKEYVLFNFNRHGILLGEGADRVHRTISAFIEKLN
jgi:esterase/lipase/1-acyl-sn-glycerol-3-phosphate acyltransferase